MTDSKPLTGRGVFIIFASAFGVIIAVNLALAYNAVRTFPGLEVKNSYVASQEFDIRRLAQESLAWTVQANAEDGLVMLDIRDAEGKPVQVAHLDAIVGRATHVKDDLTPAFAFDGRSYVARATLGAGNWNVRMKAVAVDGTEFSQRVILHIKE
ncbi:MAG: FixH family protein [Planktotalea sp.]|uniref:FixH family protein n=1 Tax=Planktotalea sp. TaxID=2029877 RepID=UPI003C764087